MVLYLVLIYGGWPILISAVVFLLSLVITLATCWNQKRYFFVVGLISFAILAVRTRYLPGPPVAPGVVNYDGLIRSIMIWTSLPGVASLIGLTSAILMSFLQGHRSNQLSEHIGPDKSKKHESKSERDSKQSPKLIGNEKSRTQESKSERVVATVVVVLFAIAACLFVFGPLIMRVLS